MKQRDLYYERIPTKLLREDIRLLGTFLGRVIKDQEGTKFFNIVERLRLLSKNTLLDKNKSKVFSKISKDIRKLSPEITFKVTRAFSHILNLMNLAESLDASRKLNEYDNPYFKNKKQNLFIEDIINNLFKNRKISDKKIYDQATKLDIGIVLTAHPTEVKRRTLIQKYANLTTLMEQRHLYKKYPTKIIEIDRKLYSEIAIIWKTDELKRTKPSPLDEARWGLAVIEDSLWDIIPRVYKRLNDIFRKNLNQDLPRNFNPIQFGSWMGGDRDGNPNVTSEVTKKVILFSRWQAAKLYERELTKLIQDLSMEECSQVIKKVTGNSFEPYRVYLRPLRDKVRRTHQLIEAHINYFHHAVEAYKIADLLAENNICAALWADWWGFKHEAYDMVQANVAIVDQARNGTGCAIVHSDSEIGIQHLNQEASKALSAGLKAGYKISKARAMKWITSNPAKAAGIYEETGSLQVGKNADVVLWSQNPFSVYALAEKVYIDGAIAFDKEKGLVPNSDFDLGILNPTKNRIQE